MTHTISLPHCLDCGKQLCRAYPPVKRCYGCAGKARGEKPEIRFWKKVMKTDHCWIWKAAKTSRGYGQISVNGKAVYAHIFSYELHHGKIPHGKCVCHNCAPLADNPSCVNPSHFFIGTHKDNMKDAVKKFQYVHGEKHADAKLTEDDVRWIRENYRHDRGNATSIARKFGVSLSNISAIILRRSWKHI